MWINRSNDRRFISSCPAGRAAFLRFSLGRHRRPLVVRKYAHVKNSDGFQNHQELADGLLNVACAGPCLRPRRHTTYSGSGDNRIVLRSWLLTASSSWVMKKQRWANTPQNTPDKFKAQRSLSIGNYGELAGPAEYGSPCETNDFEAIRKISMRPGNLPIVVRQGSMPFAQGIIRNNRFYRRSRWAT